jgi:hypothetical protein
VNYLQQIRPKACKNTACGTATGISTVNSVSKAESLKKKSLEQIDI